MAGIVPIEVIPSKGHDLVHMDDDKYLRMAWKMEAKKKSKNILSLSDLSQLENHLPLLDLETPFFLDQDLGENKASGITIAKTLHEKGFKNLYLCTGYRKKDLPDLPWIKDVLPKDVNFSQFLL
jgi:hypothetical protein